MLPGNYKRDIMEERRIKTWTYKSINKESELDSYGYHGWEAYAVTVNSDGTTTFYLKKSSSREWI